MNKNDVDDSDSEGELQIDDAQQEEKVDKVVKTSDTSTKNNNNNTTTTTTTSDVIKVDIKPVEKVVGNTNGTDKKKSKKKETTTDLPKKKTRKVKKKPKKPTKGNTGVSPVHLLMNLASLASGGTKPKKRGRPKGSTTDGNKQKKPRKIKKVRRGNAKQNLIPAVNKNGKGKNDASNMMQGNGFANIKKAFPQNATKHVRIAFYIFYQQKHGQQKAIKNPVQNQYLDPTAEARKLKQRTEYMKRQHTEQPQMPFNIQNMPGYQLNNQLGMRMVQQIPPQLTYNLLHNQGLQHLQMHPKTSQPYTLGRAPRGVMISPHLQGPKGQIILQQNPHGKNQRFSGQIHLQPQVMTQQMHQMLGQNQLHFLQQKMPQQNKIIHKPIQITQQPNHSNSVQTNVNTTQSNTTPKET